MVSNEVVGEYSIPLTVAYWGKISSGPIEATTDGLKMSTTGYRNGNHVMSNQAFDLVGKDVYIKWLKHNAGSYMRGSIGIMKTEAWVGDIDNFSADTWLHTRIRVNADKTVEVVTSTGDYDDASSPGAMVASSPTTITDANWYNVQNAKVYFNFGDTKNTEAYLTVGEVKISNSIPINMETQTVYNFDDGLIPTDFTSSGAWSVDSSEPVGGNSLYISGNIDDYVAFTVTNAAAIKVRFKIVHDGGDTAPLAETATSLMFSRNDIGVFQLGVYSGGTTAVPSEWCEFTVSANSLGDATFSFMFSVRDGQKLWIDEIEVMKGGGEPGIAEFSATPLAGTAPLEVEFTDQSVGATSWSWDFNNDGTEDDNTQNPSYTYTDVGIYSVKLTVSDGTNSDTIIKSDYINVEAPANDWAAQAVVVYDTDEADVVVRTGDIDNLGFGWPVDFDPFSGASTPAHGFPWAIDPSDAAGTDRIMVVSSYDGNPPFGSDGYTSATSRPDNIPEPISLSYDLQGRTVTSAIFQLFVDDFQALYWGAEYSVSLDGVNFPVMAEMINTLSQTGPVGKLITVPVTPDLLPLLNDGSVALIIDDLTTGAGDGFAIDFAKLLMNPITFTNTGSITGIVVDEETSDPIQGAEVWANNLTFAITNESGEYTLDNIVAGLVYLQVIVPGFTSQSVIIDLENDETENYDFSLISEGVVPETFTLLEPVINSEVNTLTPSFVWNRFIDELGSSDFNYTLTLGAGFQDLQTYHFQNDTTFQIIEDLLDNTIYYWSVMASDTSGMMVRNTSGYQSFRVNMGNDNPSVVDLITPDSVMVLSLTPEMVWTPATDADPGDIVSYEMHWWGEGIEYDSVLTDTNAVFLPRELEDNTQYFWDVITMDIHDGISQSTPATFWTDLEPEAPAGFALLSPGNETTGLSNLPTFLWEIADDPDPLDYATYTFQIATDSAFTDIAYETNTNVDVGHELTESLAGDAEYWWKVIATDTDSLSTESEVYKFTVGYVSVAEIAALPIEFTLKQNYPNPFNPSTTIRYGLPEDSNVSLIIYDLRGNVVQTVESEHQSAGWYNIVWNGQTTEGKTISTGIYFARLVAGEYSQVIKMLYLK